MTDTNFDIPYVKLQFLLEMTEDTLLPRTKVSALRGGLGEMLLLQNCVRDRDCDTCPYQDDCVVWDTFYSRMEQKPGYVTGKGSVGYLIECNDRSEYFPAGSHLKFHLILFGKSIVFFNIFLQAFSYLGVCGLGKYHSKFRICEVRNTQGRRLLTDYHIDMREYQVHSVADYIWQRKQRLNERDGRYVLSVLFPLSIKYHGDYMDHFSGEALVESAVRRIQMLNYYIGHLDGAVEQWAEIVRYPVIASQQPYTEETRRYSSTQDAKMSLRGICGNVVFETMPPECLDYLLAGELTHIGKNTSFGFGQYVIDREE